MMMVASSILCFQSSRKTLAKAPNAASVHTDTHNFKVRLLHTKLRVWIHGVIRNWTLNHIIQ